MEPCGHDDIYFKFKNGHAPECTVDRSIPNLIEKAEKNIWNWSYFRGEFQRLIKIGAFGFADVLANWLKATESQIANLCDHGFVNDYYTDAIRDSRKEIDKNKFNEAYKTPYDVLVSIIIN